MSNLKIGLQLISVKDLSPQDLCMVIEEVGKVGYQGVEFARGYFGKTVAQLEESLKKSRMVAVSDHVFMEIMRERLDEVLDHCRALGMKQVVALRGFSEHITESEERAYIRELREMGEKCRRKGVKLAIHSSTDYFQRDESGKRLFERIFEQVEPELLEAQVDTAWALCGGETPADFIRKFKGRISTVHIKDFHPPVPAKGDIYQMRDEASTRDSAVGDNGVQDIPAVLQACKDAGTEWVIVEHIERDSYENSLQATAVSLANVRKYL